MAFAQPQQGPFPCAQTENSQGKGCGTMGLCLNTLPSLGLGRKLKRQNKSHGHWFCKIH